MTTRVGLVVQPRSAEVQASSADAVHNDLLDGLLPPDNPPHYPAAPCGFQNSANATEQR